MRCSATNDTLMSIDFCNNRAYKLSFLFCFFFFFFFALVSSHSQFWIEVNLVDTHKWLDLISTKKQREMSDLNVIRSILYSKNINSNNVKPYTGLHFNTSGIIMKYNCLFVRFEKNLIYFRWCDSFDTVARFIPCEQRSTLSLRWKSISSFFEWCWSSYVVLRSTRKSSLSITSYETTNSKLYNSNLWWTM